MTQEELRAGLIGAMEDYLLEVGMPELRECFLPPYEGEWDGIDKAMVFANRQLNSALRQISRIATRMGYIEKKHPSAGNVLERNTNEEN